MQWAAHTLGSATVPRQRLPRPPSPHNCAPARPAHAVVARTDSDARPGHLSFHSVWEAAARDFKSDSDGHGPKYTRPASGLRTGSQSDGRNDRPTAGSHMAIPHELDPALTATMPWLQIDARVGLAEFSP